MTAAPAAPAPVAGGGGVPVVEPRLLLADPEARDALRAFVDRLRSFGYDGSPRVRGAAAEADPHAAVLISLARGEIQPTLAVSKALGAHACSALRRSALLLELDGESVLNGKLFPTRSVLTFLPRPHPDADVVYLGPDSIALLEAVWQARGFGDRAVDLGTGNGFLAAALATRYDHVVAADLSDHCVATAAMVPVMNPHLSGRFTAVAMDLGAGLRRGAFDLVTANAPWVPETEPTVNGVSRLFAAGGPTGFELPRRFLDEAVALLAPGGRAFVACTDLEFADGRRPLMDHLPTLEATGVEVAVIPTGINQLNDFTEWARRRAPGARSGRHVVVRIQRRG